MIKFRLYFDKDKEIEWLNKMSDNGWAFVNFFLGFYVFKQSDCKYTYQIDFSDKPFKINDEYREIMKDANIEIVQNWFYWIIVRKPKTSGDFKLYTDVESKITYYTKIKNMFKVVGILESICFFIQLISAATDYNLLKIIFANIIACIILVFVNIINKTTNKINKLKEEKTGIAEMEKKNISICMEIGLLLNLCALLLKDVFPNYLFRTIQIAAIILMLTGIRSLAKKRNT